MSDLWRAERDDRSDNVLLARAICGVAGLLLLFSLSLVWLDPPYSIGEDEYYTGWVMLAEGLGLSDRAPHLCGRETCESGGSFADGAIPTLAVAAAGAFLLVTMRWPKVVWRRVAIGLCVVSLLSLLGLWSRMRAAADATSFPDQNNLRGGLWAVLIVLVAGMWAAVSIGRDRSRRGHAG